MINQLPISVQNFMQNYLNALNKNLPSNLIEGVYIYGSIALGAFNEAKSDIDFIVSLKRSANAKELEFITNVHSQMNNTEYGKRMDGVYVRASLVGKTNEELSTYLFCAEGTVSLGHWDLNHITWWILKEDGITLQGTPIAELAIPTEWIDVLNTLKYNMNQYWFNKTKNADEFLADEMVEFTTTTICRIICSLEQRDIISKDKAVNECLKTLPERWSLLLKEGARIRNDISAESFYKSNVKRAEECREFILYAHKLCNEKFFNEE
ncbi:nucleotidyltransferase domain-containing protein [Psychrobacillus vulpis]|uniref:DUF4111 domain-containing protein n=1 Tax=Psychrobacillus vulpis TaxID=2325572 RepID=A0A544TW05_9BACI|nr:nucleotidyltransferase domain-containing protein [Psychrobacillus vulpis]TQR21638.1 DUF4111 domain-containing protein [Psychrobacillus vulpis]